jgi:hypothetical protein
MPRSWRRRSTSCLARRLSRLGSGCRRPPVRAWRSTGRTGIRVVGRSAGCVMLALVLLVMKNGELAGESRESLSYSLRRCCRCIKLRPGLSLFLLLAGMRSVFIGMMGTRVGSTPGITFAVIAFALSVPLLPESLQKRSLGLPPDFLSTLLASRNFMRLSLMKAAHVALVSASSRKSGSPHLLRPTYAGANVGHRCRVVLPGRFVDLGMFPQSL